MKAIVLGLLVSVMLVGCGGGGGSGDSPSTKIIDNSLLAEDENQYGYFGTDVIFGGIKIAGGWDLYNGGDIHDSLYASFDIDGTGWLQNQQNSSFSVSFVYGVSKDGQVIQTSEQFMIKILAVIKNGSTVTYEGVTTTFDCYNVELINLGEVYNMDMCPSGRY
ncbi:MAG TPA: hypothetical protein PLH07_05110 [Sulfurovum sp.]|nr:MAG: hypothetical protein B7Y23_02590 [Sulfurovum sp. 16-42-52]OYZ48804.1 MAG: hypothetical protein B7Y13_06640 [Sulfurovum sp. 24-42-9]OZA46492.1 MAG: hypothetical protein B7X80_01965 [Sulfurovum sp. 17-42-90]OZA59088.1 MAG: hypothetical protein B7X69_09425 [Sulfurovum sp. 39-42-12]HQR74255.1 hypothetical protein [Sulfurovum sp.]